ncbi:hypothetical protein GVN20_02065 [Runella sp. CRIBMP]|uniref:hypothetical protein n=1 Tax=Runella sp. CRIBMP TaxID=2683261 RepID=UPI0014125015|nr:hypothetical protein [Runella sp. CRIBMP]NBB18127.1 hypothetical protein [Runella sp. CRIBMP]
MTIKRVFIGILLVLVGCERKDIIETYVFSDMTKTQYFFYKIKREDSIVDINVKGYMDGSLGVMGKGLCSDTTEFKARKRPINISQIDSLTSRFYTVHTDSIKVKEVEEGTQAGLILALEFIQGTAKKGKIEVVFREHGYGF